jgi:hypothetical protein
VVDLDRLRDDALLRLSLLSEEARERVERFRDERREWAARREEARAAP